MKLNKQIVSASILYFLSGCAGAVSGDPETASSPRIDEPEAGAAADETPRMQDAALVRGNVSGTFTMTDSKQCEPFGLPITEFLTGVFAPNALVSEATTQMSDMKCLHEQVLEGSADSWATLVYNVLCGGGGDPSLCGAATTRLCSVNQLMQWAAGRSDAISARDSIVGFEYVISPQGESARVALYRRTQQEVQSLLDETAAVMSDRAAGTRRCPDENPQDIAAARAEGSEIYRQLANILSGNTPKGP